MPQSSPINWMIMSNIPIMMMMMANSVLWKTTSKKLMINKKKSFVKKMKWSW